MTNENREAIQAGACPKHCPVEDRVDVVYEPVGEPSPWDLCRPGWDMAGDRYVRGRLMMRPTSCSWILRAPIGDGSRLTEQVAADPGELMDWADEHFPEGGA